MQIERDREQIERDREQIESDREQIERDREQIEKDGQHTRVERVRETGRVRDRETERKRQRQKDRMSVSIYQMISNQQDAAVKHADALRHRCRQGKETAGRTDTHKDTQIHRHTDTQTTDTQTHRHTDN